MFRRYHLLFFPLTLTLFTSIAASPQSQTLATQSQAPTATLKTNVRRVLVDVVVTNDKGEAVTGLPQSDFEVLEDGKPQNILTFEEHHAAGITQITLPPLPPNVYTNFPITQKADSINVLLLDALNTPSRDQTYVHTQMIKYLKTIPAGTRVGIFTLASRLRMLQGITTDSSALLAILNGSKAGPQQSALLASDTESESNQSLIDFMIANSNAPAATNFAQASIDPINAMKQFLSDTAAFQTELRVRLTLEALQQLARYLSTVPGRKNVLWFSGSFPTGIFPDQDVLDPFNTAESFEDDIRKTADLLATSQMALYPIAAEGLATDSVYEANGKEIGQKRPSIAMRDQVQQMKVASTNRDLSHNAMEELAKDTGGQAFYNTNGLGNALERVVNNGTRYYSLTYSPSNANMDGKFRRIQVKLASGKHNLAYRRGYYADDLQSVLGSGLKPDSDPLMPFMGRNLPDYSQILYKILVEPTKPQPPAGATPIGSNTDMKGPFTRYGIDFAISVRDLKLEPAADGARHGMIEVMLVAYDREGKPLNLVVTKGDVLLKPAEYVAVQRGGLQIHKEIDVPKDYAYLRTGVYDLKASTTGTLGVPLLDAVAQKTK